MIFLVRRSTLAWIFFCGSLLFSVATYADTGAVSLQQLSSLFISAFEKNDVSAMELLICWDDVGEKSRGAFMNQIKSEMGGRITEIHSQNIERETFSSGDYEKIIRSLNVRNPTMLVYIFEKSGETKGGGKFIGDANGRFYISGFKDPKSIRNKIFLVIGVVIALTFFFRRRK